MFGECLMKWKAYLQSADKVAATGIGEHLMTI